MRNECKQIVAVGALLMAGLTAAANAQAQASAQGDSTIVVEKPSYVTIASRKTFADSTVGTSRSSLSDNARSRRVRWGSGCRARRADTPVLPFKGRGPEAPTPVRSGRRNFGLAATLMQYEWRSDHRPAGLDDHLYLVRDPSARVDREGVAV